MPPACFSCSTPQEKEISFSFHSQPLRLFPQISQRESMFGKAFKIFSIFFNPGILDPLVKWHILDSDKPVRLAISVIFIWL